MRPHALLLAAARKGSESWPTRLGNRLSDLVVPALISLAIVVATLVISRLVSRRMRNDLRRGGMALNASILLSRAAWVATWAIGIVLVLYQFDIGLTPLAALVGVVGLAAGLSLQAVLQNLVAGVYLLAERPFNLGDTISVVGPFGPTQEGVVEDIQMRTTHLRNLNGELILIPNGVIFSGLVTNRTAVGGFASQMTLTFPRATDPQKVREQAFPLLESLPSVLTSPEPQLRVQKVAADSWTGSLAFWAKTPTAVSDVILAMGRAFPDATVNDVPAL